tara:strand:+ start:2372 stop:2827 length:456 start_codon:yes stop_codon:yes gene_type:complete
MASWAGPLLSPQPADSLRVLRSVCESMRRDGAKPVHWEPLEFLCPDALPLAADILDHRSVIRCVSKETRREFWQVSQKAKQTYCVIPGWCSCQSYSFEVLGSRNKLVCKHELAVMLATALGLGHTNELDEEKWAAELDLATRFSLNAHGGA